MRVRYIGATIEQIRWGSNDDPRPKLVVGEVYHVKRREVHSWHTKIELELFPGLVFNDASFEYVKEDGG